MSMRLMSDRRMTLFDSFAILVGMIWLRKHPLLMVLAVIVLVGMSFLAVHFYAHTNEFAHEVGHAHEAGHAPEAEHDQSDCPVCHLVKTLSALFGIALILLGCFQVIRFFLSFKESCLSQFSSNIHSGRAPPVVS